MINVIFVCMGNICRSPAGEGVFKNMVRNAGYENKFFIDSAGMDSYHVGEAADRRMRRHAAERGYELTSRSRRFKRADLKKFDYILAMDAENYRDILRLGTADELRNKVYLMNEFSVSNKGRDVPDPWYGGEAGFELVLDMIEESCTGLLERIKKDHEF